MMYRTASYAEGTWDTFWFEKNLQGDVIAVYDNSGAQLVKYIYGSAWGDHSTTYPNGGSTSPAQYNPFRYRGYYYDDYLMLYYLQSRYYDPNTCRFISPDDFTYLGANGDLTSYNLYAYCSNNPVNFVDPNGHFVISAISGAIIALALSSTLIGGVSQLVSNAIAGETDSDLWRGVAGASLGTATNALTIFLTAPYWGTQSLVVAAGISAFVQTGVDTVETMIRGEKVDWTSFRDLVENCATTVVGNHIGGSLAPTNNGWFVPKRFQSVFTRSYGQKILIQTAVGAAISGGINFSKKYNWENIRPYLIAPAMPLFPHIVR